MKDPSIIEPSRRYHGFDALRAFAMLLGIVLHAGVTWMTARSTYVAWILDHETGKPGFDLMVWWIHGWRIPAFFVMAGFFAAMMTTRRGARGFLEHRVKRLLVPLLVASITVLPLVYAVWVWGLASEGRVDVEWGRLVILDPGLEVTPGDPVHLWFLWDLVLFSALMAGITRIGVYPARLPSLVRRLTTSLWRPLVYAIPAALFFLMIPELHSLDSHGLRLPPGGLVAKFGQLGRNGWFFMSGILLYGIRDSMAALTRGTWLYLASAQVVFAATWPALFRTASNAGAPLSRTDYLIVAGGLNLFCWMMIFGLIGIALRYFDVERTWQRWLSDSAYWVYLVHLPMVGALLVLSRHWDTAPETKFVAIVIIVAVSALLSYRAFVRHTWIGGLLNGPR